MAVFKTFHERQKKLRGDGPDVFSYDEIPRTVRVQVVQIMHDVLGTARESRDEYGRGPAITKAYKVIVGLLRKSLGEFRLPGTQNAGDNYVLELGAFILAEPDVEKVLSAVELVCRLTENMASRYDYRG